MHKNKQLLNIDEILQVKVKCLNFLQGKKVLIEETAGTTPKANKDQEVWICKDQILNLKIEIHLLQCTLVINKLRH